MAPFFARITFSFELSTPKLTFPPSLINFPSGGPFPLSPPCLEGKQHRSHTDIVLSLYSLLRKLSLQNIGKFSHFGMAVLKRVEGLKKKRPLTVLRDKGGNGRCPLANKFFVVLGLCLSYASLIIADNCDALGPILSPA